MRGFVGGTKVGETIPLEESVCTVVIFALVIDLLSVAVGEGVAASATIGMAPG